MTTGFSVSCTELRFLHSNMLAAGALLLVLSALSVHGEDPTLDSLNVDNGNSTDDTNDWWIDLLDDNSTCDPNPCFHGGSCEATSATGFICTCAEPYIGKRCQRLRNVCENVDCGHGDCVVNFQQPPFFECKCEPPFYGPDCKSLPASVCEPSPCQNGGSCIEQEQSFQCACPEGYTGKFCESAPTDCYEGNGETYRGVTSLTKRGQECLNWNSYFIMSHTENPFSVFSNSTGLEYNNHCRNPDRDKKPWCYIKREDRLLWDYCNIRKCSEAPTPAPPPDTAKPEITPFSECGIPEPTGRIRQGIKSFPGDHPWQASVQMRELSQDHLDYPFVHQCGGILLDSCWVLTAGHCILENTEIQVFLGGVNIDQKEEIEQIIPVTEIIRHENYWEDYNAKYNDLALLKLKVMNGSYCAKETRFVRKACLPEHDYKPGHECVISGWGKTKTERKSNQLLNAEVNLISGEQCKTKSAYGNVLDNNMICAGSFKGGVDACRGDSGGPLMCEENEKHYVTGVVSWAWGCGLERKPGVYANVYKFINWIKDKIN